MTDRSLWIWKDNRKAAATRVLFSIFYGPLIRQHSLYNSLLPVQNDWQCTQTIHHAGCEPIKNTDKTLIVAATFLLSFHMPRFLAVTFLKNFIVLNFIFYSFVLIFIPYYIILYWICVVL